MILDTCKVKLLLWYLIQLHVIAGWGMPCTMVLVSTESTASTVLVSTLVHFGTDVVPVLWYWFQLDHM